MVDTVKSAGNNVGKIAKNPTTWIVVGGGVLAVILLTRETGGNSPAPTQPQYNPVLPGLLEPGDNGEPSTSLAPMDWSPVLSMLPGIIGSGGGFQFSNGDTDFIYTPAPPAPIAAPTPVAPPTFAEQINQLFGNIGAVVLQNRTVEVDIGSGGTGSLSLGGITTPAQTIAEIIAALPGGGFGPGGGTVTTPGGSIVVAPAPASAEIIPSEPVFVIQPVGPSEPVITVPVLPQLPQPIAIETWSWQKIETILAPWRVDQRNWSTNLYRPRPDAFSFAGFSYNPNADTVTKYNNMGSGTTNRGSAFGVFLYRLNMNMNQMRAGSLAKERQWMKSEADAVKEAVMFVNKNAANGTTGLAFNG